ncbi:hypothetical protein FH972_021741 [Carpinus fangiana]|uniref:Ribonuclease n=1 Tax=Carpinus fangiana TaxID=176857 RepID=A0A5N6KQ66_9ROSI|nr:hypothetical protein FH972_021741 [Carpinus fangiana]
MSQQEQDTNMDDVEATQGDSQELVDLTQETPPEHIFVAPSIHKDPILEGKSYSHFSPLPEVLSATEPPECVLGPMVYGILYMPIAQEKVLLKDTHHFDDSKALTPIVRSNLMQALCTPGSDLHQSCGWATRVMSARDISADMMKPSGAYNLNAQAMDATVDLIQGVFERGVNIKEIYVDTIGKPEIYQKKLERIFPTTKVTVAKKADSLYPCVSAASVCAKVTRDAALEVCHEPYANDAGVTPAPGWGSGYPSDARCTAWLKSNMHPLFGWGPECRFSWGTAKDLLESKPGSLKIDWPEEGDDDALKVTSFFAATNAQGTNENELASWYGNRVTEEVF